LHFPAPALAPFLALSPRGELLFSMMLGVAFFAVFLYLLLFKRPK